MITYVLSTASTPGWNPIPAEVFRSCCIRSSSVCAWNLSLESRSHACSAARFNLHDVTYGVFNTYDDVIEFYSVFISLELDVRFLDQLLHLVLTFLDHCDFLQQQQHNKSDVMRDDVTATYSRQLLLDVIVDEVDALSLLSLQETLFSDREWSSSVGVRLLQNRLKLLQQHGTDA